MIDVAAILSLTEPARSHPDTMARLELRDDLLRLLRSYEQRKGLPVLINTTPDMRFREALITLIRRYEDIHGFETSVPTLRSADKKARKEAA